jgi:hypothetical protein
MMDEAEVGDVNVRKIVRKKEAETISESRRFHSASFGGIEDTRSRLS